MLVKHFWLAILTAGLASTQNPNWRIVIVFVVDQPTPFLEETLGAVSDLHLPPETRLEVHVLQTALNQLATADKTLYRKHHRFAEAALYQTRNVPSLDRLAIACASWTCDFALYLNALVHFRRPSLLLDLCRLNMTAVAPFAATLTDIPVLTSADLILPAPRSGLHQATRLRHILLLRSDYLRSHSSSLPVAMKKGLVLLTEPPVANLLRRDSFQAGLGQRHIGELWEIFANPTEWEERYLHPEYHSARRRAHFETPCPDVYWIPLFSRTFCHHIRDEMEVFGLWSRGHKANEISQEADIRRVEIDLPYATVDIYMWQIYFNTEYMWILKKYLYPIQLQVFPQHDDYPYTQDNFVVRYRMGEQVKLESHFDQAKISLNVALSVHGEEYEGGGTLFERYDCSVVQTRQGWGILHPNRPTHRHLGMELTNGTRYILVSFLDGQQYVVDHGEPAFDMTYTEQKSIL